MNGDIVYSDLGRRDVDTGCFALGILINILDKKKGISIKAYFTLILG